ncbi:hypothetical protein [Streptomyces rimosus]|uniref:hypothetical protein n=1 Tax=Streptomyces rimosus TaxID=1927 RepID=UPI0004C74DB8|nr:hypothetical protein [Streptomyces rimosus]
MHGPVTAPPPHRPAARRTVVLLRVVFVAVAVLSLGFLAWLTLLRAAVVQRRPLGWWVFGADLVLFTGAFILTGSADENSWQANTGVGLIVFQMAAAVAYYLVADVRAHRVAPGWPPYGPPGAGPAYGGHPGTGPAPAAMPPAPNPYAGAQQPPATQYAPPVTQYGPSATQYNPPATQYDQPAAPYGGQPQRINQVRAELDELSDYLRREEGR